MQLKSMFVDIINLSQAILKNLNLTSQHKSKLRLFLRKLVIDLRNFQRRTRLMKMTQVLLVRIVIDKKSYHTFLLKKKMKKRVSKKNFKKRVKSKNLKIKMMININQQRRWSNLLNKLLNFQCQWILLLRGKTSKVNHYLAGIKVKGTRF